MVPNRWREYSCEDYFVSALAKQGYWHEPGQVWIIEAGERIEGEPETDFLQVGRPGVDRIGFGYRKHQPGLWAFHRMESRFQYLAASLQEFLEGWLAGRITI